MSLEDVLTDFAHWLQEKGYVEAQVPDAREAAAEFIATWKAK